jgi:hypothetical protein
MHYLACENIVSLTPSSLLRPHPPPKASQSHDSHYTPLSIPTNMLTMPPRARQAPEVREVFELYLLVLQHSSFGWRSCKRTPGVCAAVVRVELEAFAAVEDAGELALDLAADLEESWRAESVCEGCEGVREVQLVNVNTKFRRQAQQSGAVLAGHCCECSEHVFRSSYIDVHLIFHISDREIHGPGAVQAFSADLQSRNHAAARRSTLKL